MNNVLEKIGVATFNFPNGASINCVSSEYIIDQLNYYFEIKDENYVPISLDDFIPKLIENNVYCYWKSKTLQDRIYTIRYKYKIKRSGLWISEAVFADALFYAKPNEISKILDIPHDKAGDFLKQSLWKDKYACGELG